MLENGTFDPALCPLLQGLSPEDIADRVANDPLMQACAAAFADPDMNTAEIEQICAQAQREEKIRRNSASGSAAA